MVHGALLTAVSKLHMEIRQHLSTQDPKPKIVSHGHDDCNQADSGFKPCCNAGIQDTARLQTYSCIALYIQSLVWDSSFMLDVEPDMVQISC